MDITCFIHCLFLCPGSKAWHLYSVHGLPIDLMQLMAEERNLFIDMEGYDKAKQHYQVSLQVKSLPLSLVGMGTLLRNTFEKEKLRFWDTWSSVKLLWLMLTWSHFSVLFALGWKKKVILTKWVVQNTVFKSTQKAGKACSGVVECIFLGTFLINRGMLFLIAYHNRKIFVLIVFMRKHFCTVQKFNSFNYLLRVLKIIRLFNFCGRCRLQNFVTLKDFKITVETSTILQYYCMHGVAKVTMKILGMAWEIMKTFEN